MFQDIGVPYFSVPTSELPYTSLRYWPNLIEAFGAHFGHIMDANKHG